VKCCFSTVPKGTGTDLQGAGKKDGVAISLINEGKTDGGQYHSIYQAVSKRTCCMESAALVEKNEDKEA